MPREERRSAERPTRRRERVVRPGAARSQLLEEGDAPANQADRYGGPLRRRDDPRNPRRRDIDGEDGDSPRGREGPIYEGEHTWGESEARRTEGERRPDESIREDVLERLDRHHEIDASEIEVLVEAGEVTLQGTVADRDVRSLAEGVAEVVAGVSLVHNRLRLARP